MKISLIVAVAANGVIGRQNQLPWHLPNDLQFFKKTTLGHSILMGRKTFDSIGKALPKRNNLVMSHNPAWNAPNVTLVHSLHEAIAIAEKFEDTELFVIGGASLFEQMLPIADTVYWTEVKTNVEGDVIMPALDLTQWTEVWREEHPADEKHAYPFAFVRYEKKIKQ